MLERVLAPEQVGWDRTADLVAVVADRVELLERSVVELASRIHGRRSAHLPRFVPIPRPWDRTTSEAMSWSELGHKLREGLRRG